MVGGGRGADGTSLVELCVAIVVMSLVSSTIFFVLITSMTVSKRLNNKCDAIDMARTSMEKIGRDVRMGRIVGDCFGTFNPALGANGALEGSDHFPSAQNPVYGASQSPPNGWPGGAFGSPPYTVGNQTLIVQVPIFDNTPGDNFGFPTIINASEVSPGVPAQPCENVETHIYRVFLDPDQVMHPGEYVLDWMKVPGIQRNGVWTCNREPAQVGPVRLVTGITGPRLRSDPSGPPRVFQYLYALNSGGPARDAFEEPIGVPRPTWGALFNGVAVNLEIRQHKDTSQINGQWNGAGALFIKSEFFMRNNTTATAAGVPR